MERSQSAETESKKPSSMQLVLYAFPGLPHAFVALPLNIVIPQFYAAHTAVTLAQIALMTTMSRAFDAVLDPMIGYLSDRTNTRLGPRKPWVLCGAIVCAVSIYFLFQPTKTANFVYYGGWSFLLYFGFTLFEIPRNAWSTELSRDYVQRTRISSYVATFSIVGCLVFWIMPILLSGTTGTTAITGAALTSIAWLYAVLMPVGIALAILFVPSGAALQERLATFRQIWHSLRSSKPLWRFYACYAAWAFGQGCYLSVMIIFLSDYMKLAAYFPFLMISFFGIQIVTMPAWHNTIKRFGKHRVWAITMVLDVMSRPLILFFSPGHDAIIPLFVLGALGALLNTPSVIAPYAVLGDVVDYDLLKTRVNKAANIFAFNTLSLKATMAVGAGLAFWILDIFGYRVEHSNSAHANLGLLICYLVIPGIMYVVSAAFLFNFPINRHNHSVIKRRLDFRASRAQRALK